MKSFFTRAFRFGLQAGIFFITFSVLLVLVLRWLPVSYTPLMFIRYVQHSGGEKARIEHDWVNTAQISGHLKLAVVCTEDQRFPTHHGFDFVEIQKAMDEADDSERHRGASTISQQTAKNVFLWPSSTYLRKGFETWFTFLIELLWGKQRILEVYLNSIEFGDGIYGCQAASKHFFHKDAAQLTSVEAARLAIVLPNPLKFNAGRPTPYMFKREAWALGQMNNYGGILKLPYDEPETTDPVPAKKKSRSHK